MDRRPDRDRGASDGESADEAIVKPVIGFTELGQRAIDTQIKRNKINYGMILSSYIDRSSSPYGGRARPTISNSLSTSPVNTSDDSRSPSPTNRLTISSGYSTDVSSGNQSPSSKDVQTAYSTSARPSSTTAIIAAAAATTQRQQQQSNLQSIAREGMAAALGGYSRVGGGFGYEDAKGRASPLLSDQDGYKAVARPAPATREGKKMVNVISNVYQLEYDDRPVYCYDVSVSLETINDDGSSRTFDVNKGPKDDASVHERNELIREALTCGLDMYMILSERGRFASDGAAMMFASESLEAALKSHNHQITVPVDKLSDNVRHLIRSPGVKNVVIQFLASKTFNIKDLTGQTSLDRSKMDMSVKQFFELVTSEFALMNHTFSAFSGGKLYRDDVEPVKIGSGQERRKGMFKGFSLAENRNGIIGALNIDVTTGTFWTEGQLLQTICEINKWADPAAAKWDACAIKRTNELIKNLRVSYTSEDGKCSFDFVVAGITAMTWSATNGDTNTEVLTMHHLTYQNKEGQSEPLANKFSNANLGLHHWPLVESKRARRRTDDPTKFVVSTEHFPIELLRVKSNQRVPLKKQGADPERAMPVRERWDSTVAALGALNLFGDGMPRNDVMDAFGIRLSRKPLGTTGIIRSMPAVTFDRGAVVDDKTSFRTGQLSFLTPAHITTLIIGVSANLPPKQFNSQMFTRALLEAARRKRMRIDAHAVEIVLPQQLHDRLRKIQQDRMTDPKLNKTVFLYIEPANSHHHDVLKLFERRFLVVTQHLTAENASKMITSRPTMENVLLKLNVKGGGHNYNVTPEQFAHDLWMRGETMIMGYDVWHPTGQTRTEKMMDFLPDPSVVGFSFNGGVKPDSFIGDYHFQQATKERVHDEVLNVRIKWMLRVFEQSRGVLPPLIVVIRDGISDGQYRHGMDELMALREGAAEYAASQERSNKLNKPPVLNYSPKFIMVIATKRHHKRMYKDGGRGPENMPAMSVVDDVITNPVLFEFLMQSHTPLQGMAKATKYTVLKDDVGTTSDAIQSLMGALCFEHQISCNAISIPEPVYQSDEWAKRGAANMRIFKDLYGVRGQFERGFTYEELTRRLAYWNCELGQTRVNA